MSDIELTEDEMLEAVIWRKSQKRDQLRMDAIRTREEENRKALSETQWGFSQTSSFMQWRAKDLFNSNFKLDSNNDAIFRLLCLYFSNDFMFITMAQNIGLKNPSMEKGIMLIGNFGVGKTWLMRLMAKNQRQVFHVHSAKEIANLFSSEGENLLLPFIDKFKNPANDANSFFQPYAGLCIDDIGTEDIKSYFGNKKNVIGDLLEQRYSKGNTGIFLHATTNLTAAQIEEFYGGRVMSRMKELFNFIELRGSDRRK